MAKLLALSSLSVLSLLLSCDATVFTIGDSAGWDPSAALTSWTAGKSFYVGDILLFQYSSYHTVNKVDKNGFETCNASSASFRSSDGNTSVPLTSAGNMYFICSVLSHCLGGMKLAVAVGTNITSPPPAAASPELSPSNVLPQNSSTNNEHSTSHFNGGIKLRSHSLFLPLFFNSGVLWWLFVIKVL